MAYLYKVGHCEGRAIIVILTRQGMSALSQGSDLSGSVLLTWHEKVSAILRPKACSLPASLDRADGGQLTEVAGVGCIVRVMADRRTL